MLINNNPEFLRNIWLELSRHRLLGMPAILAAIFLLVYLITEPNYADPINTVASVLYYLLTLLWGTRLAGDALINEIRDHTWDQQRMTSIPPWSMAWGKLFGSTVFVWYGALLCMLVYAITAWQTDQADIIKDVVIMLAIAILAHAVAMLMSLQSISRKRELNRTATNSFMIIGIVAAFPFIKLSLHNDSQISWFDTYFHAKDFFLVSLLFFCAWLLIAIYRNMRSELQFRSYPLVWLSFLVFFTLYLTGLVGNSVLDNEQIHTLRLSVAFASLAMLTYVMIFMENKDPILFRRMMLAISKRDWRKLLEHVPNWLITLLAVYLVCPFLIMADYSQLDTISFTSEFSINFKSALIATALFLSRDILLILFFNFSKNRKRADFTALIYLAALYWLIPSILGAMGMVSVLPIFFPFGANNASLSILSGLLQSALLFGLLVHRYRKL